MNINKKLDSWVENKLITQQNKKAILDFENTARRPILLYALSFLSAFCIILGFVALIAANWYQIPNSVKLTTDFTILALLVYGISFYKDRKPLFSEIFMFIYAGFALASIGLVAQIYHLASIDLSALLFWSVIVSPLAFLGRKKVLPLLWIPAFTVSLLDVLDNRWEWFSSYIVDFFEKAPLLCSLIFIHLFAAKVIFWDKFLKKRFPALFSSMQIWLIITIVIFSIFADCISFKAFFRDDFTSSFVYPLIIVCLIISSIAFILLNTQNEYKYLSYALLTMLIFTIIGDVTGFSALYSIIMLGIVGYYGYQTNKPRLINAASALMALRFFIAYLQVFGSLLDTGIGLIISGFVFMGVAYACNKTRASIVTNINGAKS